MTLKQNMAMTEEMTHEQRKELSKLLKDRRPAEFYGISPAIVNALRIFAVENQDSEAMLKADMMQAHLDGLRTEEIADRFNVTVDSVREIFTTVLSALNRTREEQGKPPLRRKSLREEIDHQIKIARKMLVVHRMERNKGRSQNDQLPPDGYEAYLERMIEDLCKARDTKDRIEQAMILARYYG